MSTEQAQRTYPSVLARIEGDEMYLVALDIHWGRILDRRRQQYWLTRQIGTHLVMTGPWEFLAPDAVSPETLAEWMAQAQDMEAAMTPEQRAHIAWRRQLQVTQFCRDVLHAAASAAYTQGSRSRRPEAIHDHLAMREQIIARIVEVAQDAHTMADMPGWLLDLAAQLGVEG